MKNQTITRFLKSLGILLLITAAGCNKDDKPKPKEYGPGLFSWGEKPNFPVLKFIDEQGQPLANAKVLVGMAEGDYAGNFGQSNSNGEFPVPADWTKPDMVTVDAPGYVRATYVGLTPDTKIFTLKKKFTSQYQLGGVTTGHPVKNKDGNIDFSLVMSAMTRQDLLNFQIQKVISPISDQITIVGQDFNIPANVSLPKQSESYIIGITIDKPQYRLFFADKGVQRVFAARGRFPFKPVVDGLRGNQEIFELINYFSINGGSIRDVNITNNTHALDIPVTDLNFTTKRAFKAPKLASNQVMVALTVSDSNGYLIPTDVKRLTSEQTLNMAVWDQNPAYLAQVIKYKNEFDSTKPGVDRLSAILLPFDEKIASEYLPLIDSPSAKGKNIFVIPQVASNLNKLTTFGLISDVATVRDSSGISRKVASAVWEIYAPGWVPEMKLPEWPWNKTAPGTRFEVSLVGTTSSATIPLGPQMMEKATHVTRSSIDY